MLEPAHSVRAVRFGSFELDMRSGELRKQGLRIKLQEQPLHILSLLLEHPGEVVTRDELRAKLWPQDTFVDFEHSLGTAIGKVRDALGDSVQSPRFVETLPRRGYRFIAPVESFTPGPSFVVTAQKEAETRPQPVEKAQPAGPGEDPPDAAASQEAIPQPPRQITTGGYTRRAIAAVVQGAMEEHRARVRWRRWAVAGLTMVGLAVALVLVLGLNVAGLRDRVSRAVGAVRELPPQIRSIAVLPLENLSHDPEQEYFADGMTEELITDLGKISALHVISRTSVMHYKGTAKTLPEIARELNVDAVVEGAVMRSGDRVRITAQLIHSATDKHLWAETYERDLRDVLALQGEVARDITNEIQIKLTPQQQARMASARPVNPEAYEAYLKGRHLEFLDDGKAVEFHQRAMQIDPTWAPPHAAIVTPILDLQLPPTELCAKARTSAGKALELDETLSEAHSAMAQVKLDCDWDWPGAEREFERALELDPSNSKAHHFYSHYLLAMLRFDESLTESRRALELDPLSELLNTHLAWHYVWAHQPDVAIEQCRKVIEVFPNSVLGHLFRMWAYEMKGQYEEAIADYLDSKMAARLKRSYGRFGARGYWQSRIDFALEQTKLGYVSPLTIAGFYAQLGQRDEAFAWLERAYDERSVWMAQLRCDPRFDRLRSDSRFQDVLRRMNFPP